MPYSQQDLDFAQRHVDEGERRLHHERYLLDQLRRAGHDTSAAQELLQILERTQTDLAAHRDRIAKELSQLRAY
jgi:hypothetical protein